MKTKTSAEARGTAPDISENYPSGGERLAPAWQKCWDLMGDGTWWKRTTLANVVAEDPGTDISPVTVANLLRQATRAGLIEATIAVVAGPPPAGVKRGHGRKRVAWVRRVGV